MDKKSTSKILEKISQLVANGDIPPRIGEILTSFYQGYRKTASELEAATFFLPYLDRIKEQCKAPHQFAHYHEQIRKPFDYYEFGLLFLRPLVDQKQSSVRGVDNLKKVEEHLNSGHNVVFFANHQTEADPQAISLLLETSFPQIGEKMIFVAGERVLTDPLAIPFSMGRNLLCIYSKRYIDTPPELKEKKQSHNKKTMQEMAKLLQIGGQCIYMAPSGGRDRHDADGTVPVAPFDPQSIEMFYLMAKRSSVPTFFFPMALSTYELLPPPKTVQLELGEERHTKRVGIHMGIGPEIDMDHFKGAEKADKHVRRKSRADYIWDLVNQDYQLFPKVSS